MAIVSAFSGYLYLDLSKANASLAETNLKLQESEATVFQIQDDLVESNADLRASVELTNALRQEKTVLRSSLDTAEANSLTLSHDLGAAVFTQDGLRSDLNGANAQLDSLSKRHLVLQADHAELNEQFDNVRQTAISIEEMGLRADALRTEIARLEARHKPLVLARTAERGSLCTGSMEPKKTCLDTATYLLDFDPADIVVGTVISFESQSCWPDEPAYSNTSHRVKDTSYRNGIYFFWPKGDANSEADGCWVPHTAVNGYMIEVHKNTTPDNATLRNNVNSTRVAYEAARNALPAAENAVGATRISLKAAENAYYRARDEYNSYLSTSISICSNVFLCQTYLVYVNQALERRNQALADWDRALDRFSRAVAHYEQAFARYEGARAYYDCWYSNAEDSEYPGHIPYRC